MIEGVEKIKGKMLSQAKEEADKILAKAKEEANLINARNKKKIDNYLNIEKEKINSETSLFKNRELASLQMESKKDFMKAREEIIDGVIEKALTKLSKAKDYHNFIEKNLKTYAPMLGKDITINCNDKDIDVVKKLVLKLKMDCKVEKADIKAGLVFIGKETRINLSIESLLEEKKMQIRQEIAKIITG